MSVTVHHNGHEISIEKARGGWLARVDGEVRTVQPTETEAIEVALAYVNAPKTGDCYEAALDTARDLLTDNAADTVFICHGRPTGQGPIEGVVHGHAWVEVEQRVEIPDDAPDEFKTLAGHVVVWVHDRSNGKDLVYPAALYYNVGRIDPDQVRRYTAAEAFKLMLRHEHWGPWHD